MLSAELSHQCTDQRRHADDRVWGAHITGMHTTEGTTRPRRIDRSAQLNQERREMVDRIRDAVDPEIARRHLLPADGPEPHGTGRQLAVTIRSAGDLESDWVTETSGEPRDSRLGIPR